MKQAVLFITCCFAGSLFLASTVAAQGENLAIAAPARTNERLRPAAAKEGNNTGGHTTAALPKDPLICIDCEASVATLPPMVRFPSNFREIFPVFDGRSYLLFGLLGLLGLGLALSALIKFGQKEASAKE